MTKPTDETRETFVSPLLPKPVYNTTAKDRAIIKALCARSTQPLKEPSSDPHASSSTPTAS